MSETNGAALRKQPTPGHLEVSQMPEQAYKRCKDCGQFLSLKQFYRSRREKDGRQIQCKVCQRARGKEWRERNPKKRAAAIRRWREEHPETKVEYARRARRRYDAHGLDVLEFLTAAEQVQAVRDAGGIESARRRTAPSLYRILKDDSGTEHPVTREAAA